MASKCSPSRRAFVVGATATAITPAYADSPDIRFGLTPVFLSNDLELLSRLQAFLSRRTELEVVLVQRRTYEEITSLLLSNQLTAAWICGYPYVAYRDQLDLVATPVWQGNPLYRSYLIGTEGRTASSIKDLEGDTHAFSDPNSNSGYLVTTAQLAQLRRRPGDFFRRTFFTYGHRNVVRAVASGLAESGSVDGYVYDVISEIEPEIAKKTTIISKSELLGFPPIACAAKARHSIEVEAVRLALLEMARDKDGAEVLRLLRLDGFTDAPASTFDGIAEKLAQVRSLG
jgi:phosphonate transport system substrate-binding protein